MKDWKEIEIYLIFPNSNFSKHVSGILQVIWVTALGETVQVLDFGVLDLPWCHRWSFWLADIQHSPGGSLPTGAAAPLETVSSGLPGSPLLSATLPTLLKNGEKVKWPENSSLMATRTPPCTFVSAELDVSKQPDLDDLPQEAEHQVRLALHQVWRIDVDHMAADGRGWVKGQVQVLLWGNIRTSVRARRSRCNDPSLLWTYRTCIVNVVLFFLLMVLSSMVSGTDRLIILLCKQQNALTHKASKKKKRKKKGRNMGGSWNVA